MLTCTLILSSFGLKPKLLSVFTEFKLFLNFFWWRVSCMWCFASASAWWKHDIMWSQTVRRNYPGEFGTPDMGYNFPIFLWIYFDTWQHLPATVWIFFYTCSVCQFNMVATKKHKHRHYYGIFSPWFPIFSFWISWMAEGQMIRIPNYKSVKSNQMFFSGINKNGA